jgi:isoleucyl-tRNA synthetase
VLGDWDNPYKTMDFKNEAGEIRALAEIVKGGFVFKGLKPVNWCFDCGSAWPKRKSSTRTRSPRTIDVAFPVADEAKLAAAFGLASLAKPADRDLDHHPVDHPGQPGAERPPGVQLRPGRHRRRLLVLAEELVESCLASVTTWKARSSPPPPVRRWS